MGKPLAQVGQHDGRLGRLAGLEAALALTEQGEVGAGEIGHGGNRGKVRLRLRVFLLLQER